MRWKGRRRSENIDDRRGQAPAQGVAGAAPAVLRLLPLLIRTKVGRFVLIAGVQASVDARMHESAILRALGARRELILGGLLIEFAALGLFAGILATAAAELSVFILQVVAMDMSYKPSPWIHFSATSR